MVLRDPHKRTKSAPVRLRKHPLSTVGPSLITQSAASEHSECPCACSTDRTHCCELLLRAALSLTSPPDTDTAVGDDTGANLQPPAHAGSTQRLRYRAGWDMGATWCTSGIPG